MRITVAGAGNVGRTLAEAWIDAGHDVTLTFSRDAEKLRETAAAIGGRAAEPAEAAVRAEAILLAVPAAMAGDALGALAPAPGQVVIDATNDLGEGRAANGAASLAEGVPGVPVVQAFNTVFAGEMAAARDKEQPPDLLIAGDDAGAVATTEELARDAGFRPIRAGGLDVAGDVEAFARLVIGLAYREKRGPFVYRLSIPS